MNNQFGNDPIDQYSVPKEIKNTKFGKLFKLNPRERVNKPGRVLEIVWDKRKVLVEDFENNYSYLVRFAETGSVAGNHYHKLKDEIFFPVVGEFVVTLENIETKDTEEIELKSMDYSALNVPAGIAHAVTSKTDKAILLVLGSSAGTESDEFPYPLRQN